MRDEFTSTLKYATRKQLIILYVVVFIGLSLLNWNLFAPLFGVVAGVSTPIAVFLRGIFGFLTAVIGFSLTIVGFVGILKTVLDDAVGGGRETEPAEISEDESTETDDASEDGQVVEAN